MMGLGEALANAPADLRDGLAWFHERRGQEIDWPHPSPVASLPHLVTQAKGIYKPAEHDVALSIRVMLRSDYEDRQPIARPDGGWVLAYHQEGHDPAERDRLFTNRALMENMARQVPVAVLIQTRVTPSVRYRVQGLALVSRWEAGFFYLEGFNHAGDAVVDGSASEMAVLEAEAATLIASGDVEVHDLADPDHDARVRTVASIVRRRGQAAFRAALLVAYDGTCVVTGCRVEEVLEAAHIQPYRGDHTNATTNGLLLRADVHTLFDLGLLAIDPDERTVIVASSLWGSEYADLAGVRLREPCHPSDRPSRSSLEAHLAWCGDRLLAASSA